MTSKMEKHCGSCKHFTNEDALGHGWCVLNECETTCGSRCNQYSKRKQEKTMKTREIKFRGKRLDNGQWAYGDLGHRQKVTEHGGLVRITTVGGYDVISDTVGQFVGLYDAQGKEIYEGDMLMCDYKFVEVIYDAPEFCYKDNDFGYKFLNYPENFKVVGTIHDNPELLKDNGYNKYPEESAETNFRW